MEIAEEWLNKNFGQESTRGNYRSHLKKFRQFAGQSLSDYFESVDGGEFWEDFKEFVRQRIEEDGLSESSITVMASIIKMFVNEATDIEFDKGAWQKFHRRYVKGKADGGIRDRAGSKEEWQSILRNMNLKGRSLFLFLLSSGCRIGEALALEKENIDLKESPPKALLKEETTKNGEERTVYFTEEARDEIKNWLDYRENLTKKVRGELTENEKENLTEEEQEKRKKELIAKRDDYAKSERVWPFSYSTAWNILNGALEKAGLKNSDEKTGWKDIRIHSTRKFFRTNCQLSPDVRNCLMGHNSGLDKSYRRIAETGRPKEEYKEKMHNLTLLELETGLKADMEELEEENRELREQIGHLQRKLYEREQEASTAEKLREGLEQKVERLSKAMALADTKGISFTEAVDRLAKAEGEDYEEIKSEFGDMEKSKQKVVDEGEVEEYLEKGWRFVNKLNDNEVIVEIPAGMN